MLNIQLISMPFAGLDGPSIGLTQLRSVTEQRHAQDVSVRINYLTLEFGRLLGLELYQFLSISPVGHRTGLGEWLFSRCAFPDAARDWSEYFACHEEALRNHPMLPRVLDTLLPLQARLDEVLDGLIARYGLDSADLVGFTSTFLQNVPSLALARRLRRLRPDLMIVMGGANCEATMGIELVANAGMLDFVFSGPSLVSFPEFVDHVLRGDHEACHRINGVFSRRNCRSVAELVTPEEDIDWGHWSARKQLAGISEIGAELDIDAEVRLDYDDYLEAQKRLVPMLPRVFMPFETSRGCWWGERAHCTFCGLNGTTMAYRAMRAEHAVRLIEDLIARYRPKGVRSYQCVDNILAQEHIEEVFGRVKVPHDVSIFYEVKADLEEGQVRTLQRGGVREIQPGIEALSTAVLKLMHKGTTAFQNIQLLMHCARHGVQPIWNLLLGFPGEKPEVYEKYLGLLPKLFHLYPPIGTFPLRFDRYSPYFTRAREYGLKLAALPYYGVTYPFPALAIRNMAYYFRDEAESPPYAMLAGKYWPALRRLVAQWQRRFVGRDGFGPARLHLVRAPAGFVIEDSRSGPTIRHPVSEADLQLLWKMRATEIKIDRLSEQEATTLRNLEDRGLVFEERERVMSLVFDLDIMQAEDANPAQGRYRTLVAYDAKGGVQYMTLGGGS
jgi:magnesium-protoporphyrin IX monomethyl ester (oxidative) cyclase